MSDMISRSALIEVIKQRMKLHEKDAENLADENFQCESEELFLRLADECQAIVELIEEQKAVELPVNDMDELKRCPFCGGEAEFFRVGTVLGDCVVVKCKNCKARTDTVLFDARKHTNDEEYDEAAALWNNRKPVDDVLEHLEEELNFADVEKKRCAKENQLQFDSAKGCAQGLYNAIIVIKEGLM